MSTKYKFNNNAGIYFVSFAVVGWIDIFTRQVYRDLFLESLVYCRKEKGLNIHAWVVMSNHIHLIISCREGAVLSDAMRDLKKFTSFKILKEIKENKVESRKEWMLFLFAKAGKQNSNNTHYQFWRQDNHPIELDFHSGMFEQKLDYIHNNPVEARIVEKQEDYLYSSARDYQGIKGLIEIDVLF
ncbi:MAG TPA: transposase [Pelobium sp.]|nr:transposase [Pelobium sp.]